MRAQSYICDLAPYQPGQPIEAVARQYKLRAEDISKLASNENPLGCSPTVPRALEAAIQQINRYPEQYTLLQALATHHKLTPEHCILGNGSNDVLDSIARTYMGVGDEAIMSEYAFAIYELVTRSVGATPIITPAADYGHDLAAMHAAITKRTKVIWIANPNNPTGTFIPYETIQQFIEQVPPDILIVLDEAYYEYLALGDQEDTTKWSTDYPNLILVRTFSKIYGLAALRVGYGMANPRVIAMLNRVRQPFNVNGLALAAATAALGDQAFVHKSYTANTRGREWLLQGLTDMNISTLPAYGNFVTFAMPQALSVYETLLRQGIIVRPLANYGLTDHLRVSVGLLKENERFLQALQQIHTM